MATPELRGGGKGFATPRPALQGLPGSQTIPVARGAKSGGSSLNSASGGKQPSSQEAGSRAQGPRLLWGPGWPLTARSSPSPERGQHNLESAICSSLSVKEQMGEGGREGDADQPRNTAFPNLLKMNK